MVKEEVKEKSRYNERTDFKDIYTLKLLSKKLSIHQPFLVGKINIQALKQNHKFEKIKCFDKLLSS